MRFNLVVRRFFLALVLALLPAGLVARAADTFMKPTKEELSMTEMPGYPGVAAVVLTYEEVDNDALHVKQYYKRIKILTERGKDLADVELTFGNFMDNASYEYEDMDVTNIQGRTIHADGTVVPFTGKPYLKTIVKDADMKYQARVFSLPEVRVGDIIEYRYAVRIGDNFYDPPDWYIQGKYFVKSAKFTWFPTSLELTGPSGGTINSITWFPILPEGVKIVRRDLPHTDNGSVYDSATQVFELAAKDIPPAPEEEFMPPVSSFTYRVMFNFSEFHTYEEYWKDAGKRWSKKINTFSDPNTDVHNATDKITGGGQPSDAKLKLIYDAVQQMENTDFTRAHGNDEDKAAGLKKVSTAADVLAHKRGSADQLTELFISMAKAAGFKAYAMWVPDRTSDMFTPMWMNTRQFDAVIAIVNLDGKEVFLDPGERYCAFGHLAWEHTFVRGLRQVEGGSALGETSGDGYKTNFTARVANLTMDDKGEVTGTVKLSFEGSPALSWRQRALEGDDESIRHGLRTMMEKMLPASVEVTVKSIDSLTEYEKPLVVNYEVKGAIGNVTGKRLLVPADLFVANDVASFPHDKRQMSVYFHYPEYMKDALRINFPTSFAVEATPDAATTKFKNTAAYTMSVSSTATSVTTRREFVFGDFAIPVAEYGDLRTFYSQFQTTDHEQVILKTAPAVTAAVASGGGQ